MSVAAEWDRKRRRAEGQGAGSPRVEGRPQRCGVVGKRGRRQGLQRGQGCQMSGSISMGSFPALSIRDAEHEAGSKRSVRLEPHGVGPVR